MILRTRDIARMIMGLAIVKGEEFDLTKIRYLHFDSADDIFKLGDKQLFIFYEDIGLQTTDESLGRSLNRHQQTWRIRVNATNLDTLESFTNGDRDDSGFYNEIRSLPQQFRIEDGDETTDILISVVDLQFGGTQFLETDEAKAYSREYRLTTISQLAT